MVYLRCLEKPAAGERERVVLDINGLAGVLNAHQLLVVLQACSFVVFCAAFLHFRKNMLSLSFGPFCSGVRMSPVSTGLAHAWKNWLIQHFPSEQSA